MLVKREAVTTAPWTAMRTGRRGQSLVYGVFTIVVLIGFVSLAVDLGRVQLAKTELRAAADAASLYAAAGLSQGVTAVQNRAVAAGAENKVDGTSLVVDPANDVAFGTWDAATRSFAVLTGSARSSATAVQVSTRRIAARNTHIPTPLASIVGRPGVDVQAVAIATRGNVVTAAVPAHACPWLAGMPSGSQVAATGWNTQPTVAPQHAPYQANGITLTPGTRLSFREIAGTTSYYNAQSYGPDGQSDFIATQDAANGINATTAPLNCLVGIFLDNRAPNTWAMAAAGNFSTAASRDFSTLSPPLKQVFFIGNGLNSAGQLQEFVIPAGATRLYLGIMDGAGWWWDNTGTLTTTMMDNKVRLVK